MSWEYGGDPNREGAGYGQYSDYGQYGGGTNQYAGGSHSQGQFQQGGGHFQNIPQHNTQFQGQHDPYYGGGQPAGSGGWPSQGGSDHYPGNAPTLNLGGSQLPLDPMVTNMAMNYGADIVNQKKKEVEGMMEKYVSIGQLKYYFAVDNSYVSKKLRLLLFPFAHSDWSIRYNHDEPVQPRFELNAADLYIPSMAFVTYILVVGYMLGLQERFSPEILATTASSALTSLVLEILVIYLTTTIFNISSTLAKWDFLAFSMYKYVGMIFCLLVGLILSSSGYYPALAYAAAALALFLFRTLHLRVEPEVHGVENHGKRKLWLLFILVAWQPLVMWWLTYSLVPSYTNMQQDMDHSGY